jgi:hypothetical protein
MVNRKPDPLERDKLLENPVLTDQILKLAAVKAYSTMSLGVEVESCI